LCQKASVHQDKGEKLSRKPARLIDTGRADQGENRSQSGQEQQATEEEESLRKLSASVVKTANTRRTPSRDLTAEIKYGSEQE